ncbi:hypothetical protein [Staphylococcus equorum]|uniref:Uncharacterized protein n=1 Tax=Staphylococcus equorum TaxID=246432 RepID=A0A9X4LCN6_9STAP|nr:hypothetical protein [Staphylococcus equorum]MDG0860569.1 hypothetical protein [Staphylococcus equorum]
MVNYIKQEHSTDLSKLSIDCVKIGSEINFDEYVEKDEVILKKHRIYSKREHPNLVFKVNKKDSQLTGITLTSDTTAQTNFNGTINNNVEKVIQTLGTRYKQKKLRKGFNAIIYIDKKNQMKLFIIYKHDKIKKIEIYKK